MRIPKYCQTPRTGKEGGSPPQPTRSRTRTSTRTLPGARIIEGIVSFGPTAADNEAYIRDVDSLSGRDLQRLYKIMTQHGKHHDPTAAQQQIQAEFPYFYQYLFQEGRADWRFYLDLTGDSKILDLGCGWGNLSFELARESGTVTAVDASLAKLRFLHARAQANKLDNIDLIHTDFSEELPFVNGYFDLVVLNGVLEWVGEYRSGKSPYLYQLQLLQEIYRVLRPGGHLYIGIENRYGFEYFLGRADDHTRIRFTNLLPRPLAHLYMLIKKRQTYRTYTYSYPAMKRLLKKAGFSGADFYYSHKDYKYFDHLVPLERNTLRYFAQELAPARKKCGQLWRELFQALTRLKLRRFFGAGRQLLAYMIKNSRLFRYIVPSFSIIASR